MKYEGGLNTKKQTTYLLYLFYFFELVFSNY